MGIHYKDSASWWRRNRSLSTEASNSPGPRHLSCAPHIAVDHRGSRRRFQQKAKSFACLACQGINDLCAKVCLRGPALWRGCRAELHDFSPETDAAIRVSLIFHVDDARSAMHLFGLAP